MDKPFYKRSEFWFTTLGAIPGISFGLADVFVKATSDGTLDPSNPLYPLFVKVAAGLIAVYTFSRQLNKAIGSFFNKQTVG